MDENDLAFCRDYFRGEHRDPTITELRMIDTYWSDHCRHTTFLTTLDNVTFEDKLLEDAYTQYLRVRAQLGRKKPVCLMDIATIAVRHLRAAGMLDKLDESEEINACTVKMTVTIDGKRRTVASSLQKRNAQPSDRNRTVRRRGNLYRRRDPRSTVRAGLRLRRYACDRRGKSAAPGRRNAARQTSAEENRHNGGSGLFLLRKPDWACNWYRRRDLSRRLRGKTHGNRRCCRRGSSQKRPPRAPSARGSRRAARRQNRPRWLRRCDWLFKITRSPFARKLRRRGAKRQRA